jgi:hypothetical protein
MLAKRTDLEKVLIVALAVIIVIWLVNWLCPNCHWANGDLSWPDY